MFQSLYPLNSTVNRCVWLARPLLHMTASGRRTAYPDSLANSRKVLSESGLLQVSSTRRVSTKLPGGRVPNPDARVPNREASYFGPRALRLGPIHPAANETVRAEHRGIYGCESLVGKSSLSILPTRKVWQIMVVCNEPLVFPREL